MKVFLTSIGGRKIGPVEALAEAYVARCARYVACESQVFEGEAQFLKWLERQGGREPAYVILLDGAGEALSSEELAGRLRQLQEGGTQRLVLAVGPADGWSAGARKEAKGMLSFGRMTLPRGLARVVLAEQVYRALTILAGHPYHSGH